MTSLNELLTNPIVERAYKTAIEAGITAAATTPVASTSVALKVVFMAGATFLSVLWNGIETAAATRKGSKLSALQAAIDAAVNSRLQSQSAANAPEAVAPVAVPEAAPSA